MDEVLKLSDEKSLRETEICRDKCITTFEVSHRSRRFLTPLKTEQTQIRQLFGELPDQSLLCLLMEIILDMILR